MTSPIARRIATSALAGIAAGLAACASRGGPLVDETIAPPGNVIDVWIQPPGPFAAPIEVQDAAEARAARSHKSEIAEPRAKNCCKGQNRCKGLGGCQVAGRQSCKGKNECKGRGGCKSGDCVQRGRSR